jgi:predicted transcriptional regulator
MVYRFMLNKEQCRAARGWLGVTQDELAASTGVAQKTIARFETGAVIPQDRTLRDLKRGLEEMGIEFLFEGARGVGVRLRSDVDPPSAKPQRKM